MLRVELGRSRLQLALLEAELNDRVAENESIRKTLDFTQELLASSVTARVVGAGDVHGRLEAWLELLVEKTKAAFPGSGLRAVGVALQRNGRYELAVGAKVPNKLQKLLPAPDATEFAECIRQHVPNAQSFKFSVAEVPHWFVVIADDPTDNQVAPVFKVVAFEVARAMRSAAAA